MPMDSTRRNWILGSFGSVAFAAIAAAHEHAHQAVTTKTPQKFDFFNPQQAADVEAIAAQILPSEDGPGAREAGVIYFIDRALTTFDTDKQDIYRKGLAEIHGISKRSHSEQLETVRSIEKSEFFEEVRIHTLLGFLGSPTYGGNRNQVGWKYIHFEDRMSWQPPFGYYDAEVK
jgi:gluconate 2-dehydrogenase gamma chain